MKTRAVFAEVIAGLLDWGHCESDGQARMADYVHGALKTAGKPSTLTDDEREQLRTSALWPFLSFNPEI